MKNINEWYCDVCDKKVNKDNGIIIYNIDEDCIHNNFKIIHKIDCDNKKSAFWDDISSLIDEDGIDGMLQYLEGDYKIDMKSYVRLFRRLHVPNFEDAIRFIESIKDNYSQSNLLNIKKLTKRG